MLGVVMFLGKTIRSQTKPTTRLRGAGGGLFVMSETWS